MGQPEALAIQLGHLADEGLKLLPGLDPVANRLDERRRHVVAGGLAFLASEADVDVRPVLLALFAAAARLAAGAVGLGNGPEDRPLGKLLHLAQQTLPSLSNAPNR